MKKISFLSIIIFIITIFVCISCGYFISNIIVVTSPEMSKYIQIEKQTFFAICMENEGETLENLKSKIQSQNGAGYIYNKNNKNYLIASIYENKNDAELVKTNLSSSGFKIDILPIECPPQKIEGNFDINQKTILTNSLKSKIDIYKKLYDVAVSYDTNVIDKNQTKIECNNIYSYLISIKTNFLTFFKKNNEKTKNIEQNLSKLEKLLSNLIGEIYESNSQTFSSLIKSTYCKIILD